MTRSECSSPAHSVCCGPDDQDHAEETSHEDQSIEEQLLLIELKEVQRELLQSKQYAAAAHASADAASTTLRTQRESMHKELGELKAQIVTLNTSLDSETARASDAIQDKENLEAKLRCMWHNGSTEASCSNGTHDSLSAPSHVNSLRLDEHQNAEVSSQGTESALWQALQKAREESASSAARAAEASASVTFFESQLKQVRGELQDLLHDVAIAVGIVVGDEPEHICSVSLIGRATEMKSELDRVRAELHSAHIQLQEEQAISLQLHEELQREKDVSEAAMASAATKQMQLDHWLSERIPEDDGVVARTDEVVLLSDLHGQGQTSGEQQGGDVTAIVSQWRCVSLQHVSEANVLAEQLAVERKALQSMRAQALMLERQVETAEDQLDSERSSYAAREVSMRAQLDNMESQVAEQDRLLGLKASAIAAAEAQAESSAAELVRSRERVRVLEDMVQSAEVELQSAIRQMSSMQEMVMSTDAKLVEAQDAMADRNDAIPGIQRLVASLTRLSGLESINMEAFSAVGFNGAMQEAERLMQTMEATASEKEDQLQTHVARCHSLEQEMMALKMQVSKDQEQLSAQSHAAMEQQVKTDELTSQRDALHEQFEDKCSEMQQVQMNLQDALTVAATRADQIQELNERLLELSAELSKVTADKHHLSGQFEACCEESASLRTLLKTADEDQLKVSSRLTESARELASSRAQAEAAAESLAASHVEADAARSKVHELASKLEDSEIRLTTAQVQLEKRCHEVRELNSMLKAWEAMRLSKDAQIAALMERCKRYDEDIAEKGRSNEALRRKLMHHHGSGSSRGSCNDHALPRQSVASSVAGSLSGSEVSRTRHIHLHMHGTGNSSAEGSGRARSSHYQLQLPRSGSAAEMY